MNRQSSRQAILDQIRHSLGRGSLPAAMAAALETRMQRHCPHLQLQREEGTLVEIFARHAQAVGACVETVRTTAKIPDMIKGYLETQQLPAKVIVTDADLDWLEDTDALSIERRVAGHGDDVVVTGVLAAIAETGTLVIPGRQDRPSSALFLPEHHIVVVRSGQLLYQQEEVWPLLRSSSGEHPRAVHMITGPSKTADIEQTLQQGAHGPRSLYILLTD